jgi:hypothetical protein
VSGETNVFDFAFLLGLENGCHRAVGSEDLFHLGRADEVMELVKVEVIRLQALEGTVEFHLGACGVAFVGLAGKEILGTVEALEPDAHFDFGVTVSVIGGDVEVIDAAFESIVKCGSALFLVAVRQGKAREADDGEFLPRAAKDAPRHAVDFFDGFSSVEDLGQSKRSDTGRATDSFEEDSAFHRFLGKVFVTE